MKSVHLVVALAAGLLAQSILAQGLSGESHRPWRDPAYNVEITEHVYGYGEVTSSPDLQALLLDLYQPVDPIVPGVRRPIILLIHGGSFVAGSRQFPPLVLMATELASRGYVVASMDYRLAGDGPVPSDRVQALPSTFPFEILMNSAVDDALTALDWLFDHSNSFNLDFSRLGLVGSSAGAVTAINLAYALNDYGIDAPAFRFVVDFFGRAFIPLGDPVAAVNLLVMGEPPLFVVHGTADSTIPIVHSENLVARALEQNVPVEFHPVMGAEHGFEGALGIQPQVDEVEPGLTIFDRMVEWIYAALFKPGCLYNSQGGGEGNTCSF